MTTKTISTYVAGFYSLSPSYSELDITKTGGVQSLYSDHFATISNAGTIDGALTANIAVALHVGGVVIKRRSGYIGSPNYGIQSNTSVQLNNYGTIRTGGRTVSANSGGTIVNGNYASLGATLSGM